MDNRTAGPSGSRLWGRIFRFFLRNVPESRMRRLRETRPDVPIEELVVVGRSSGEERRMLISLLRVGDAWYIGHPNGDEAQWVRNLESAGHATILFRDGRRMKVTATLLPKGDERAQAIQATGRMPAPAGQIYRMG